MTTDAVGGVWRYAIDLAGGLERFGWRVTLAVLGPAPDAAQRAEALAVSGLELIETGLKLDWTAADAGELRESARAVARIARGYDVVHLNSPTLAAGSDFDPPLVIACHSCVASWWRAVRDGPLPPAFEWQRELTAAGYRAADRLIAPSAAFAAATEAVYGVRPEVVFNGRAPTALEANDHEDFVFTAGRLWDDGKNVHTIDAAAALLRVPVIAAGSLEGPNGARIEVRNLRTPGRLDSAEIGRHLAARPVFVSTARYEPFGLAVLEAAQAGCALVLSDIPSFREIWGDAAEYVGGDDASLWAAALRCLLNDPAERSARGLAAQTRAARYTVEAMTDGMARHYGAALAQRKAMVPA